MTNDLRESIKWARAQAQLPRHRPGSDEPNRSFLERHFTALADAAESSLLAQSLSLDPAPELVEKFQKIMDRHGWGSWPSHIARMILLDLFAYLEKPKPFWLVKWPDGSRGGFDSRDEAIGWAMGNLPGVTAFEVKFA